MRLLRIGALACALAIACAPAFAATNRMQPVPGPGGYPTQPIPAAVTPYTYAPLGCVQLTSLSAATGLTVPSGATLVLITVEGQSVRYRDDGTNPTATVGPVLPVGVAPWAYTGTLASIKFIQTTSAATVDACFYQ